MSTVIETTEIEITTVSEEEARRRETLLRAAELIEERGYTTGTEGMTPDGQFCLMGAVGHAMGAPLVYRTWPSLRGLKQGMIYDYTTVQSLIPGTRCGMDIWLWSDRQKLSPNPPGRVARVLRRLANGANWEQATRDG